MVRNLTNLFPCLKGKARWGRAIFWVALALSTGYTVQGQRNESRTRESQLCGVVVNVHANAQSRAATERENLQSTRDYLKDPDSKRDSPSLYKRVQENLPIAEQRVHDAEASVTATRIPPVCQRYVDDGHKT